MYCFKQTLFIILILTSNVNLLDIPVISDLQDIIGLVGDIQSLAAGNYPFKSLITGAKNPLVVLVDTLSDVEKSVTELEDTFSDRLEGTTETIMERLPLEIQIGNLMDDFFDQAMRIEFIYETFEYYVPLLKNVSQVTMEKYVDSVVGSDFGGLRDTLEQMYRSIVPDRTASEKASLFELLERRNTLYGNQKLCESFESPQQQMYLILNVILIGEIRSFATIGFAYKLQSHYYNVSIEEEVTKARAEFVMRISDYISEAQKYIAKAPRLLYRCDPSSNRQDLNYVDFGNIFSLYIINEWQGWSSTTCSYTCSSLDTWDTHRSYYDSQERKYDQLKKCRGHIWNCFLIAGVLELCEYDESSPYRYQWLSSNIGYSYGQRTDCRDGKYNVFKESMSGFYQCDTCACQCSESWAEVTEMRSFSLRPQITDVENNMVLSNVKFTKKNSMVHLQIEQSPLLPSGRIDKSRSTWVELDEMIYSSDRSGGGFQDSNNDNKWYVRGQDFQFLQRPGTYGMDIDDILAPEGYVLTGARLYHSYPEEGEFDGGNDLHLNIHVSPFDFKTGKLTISDDTPSIWLTPQNQPKMPEEYLKDRYVLPTGGNPEPWPSPVSDFHVEPNLEINFEPSYYGKDVGKRTIPYVDIRPAAMVNRAAIDGMGFVYRSQKDHIGFLALKLYTFNVGDYIDSTFSKEQYDYYKGLYKKKTVNEPKISG